MAQRIRRQDLVDGIIDSTAIQNSAVTISKIKTNDTGDGTGINAETLPFGHGFPTPTIADKINAIIGNADWTLQVVNTNGITASYLLPVKLDLTAPCIVFFNGQLLSNTYDYNITNPGLYSNIIFNWIPENSKQIVILAQLF